MRRVFVLVVALALATLVTVPALGGRPDQANFRAHLSGANEVPAVMTNATGQAIFKLSTDGESLSFKLIAANIEDVHMAHIHCGPTGANGPIIAWLYPDAPPPLHIEGRFNGVLAEGTLDAGNVVVVMAGASQSCPGGVGSFDDLVDQMRAGNTYTNVHTMANPGGEIRGQNR